MGNTKTKYLGLDVSSTLVGYSQFRDTTLVTYGKFQPKGSSHGEKLKSFYVFLLKLFKDFQPDNVILEIPFRGSSYAILSMYIGVVLMAHAEVLGYELPKCNKVRPIDVKRALGLPLKQSHETHKRNMLKKINKLYGLRLRFRKTTKTKSTDDDIADAIAVVHAWHILRG